MAQPASRVTFGRQLATLTRRAQASADPRMQQAAVLLRLIRVGLQEPYDDTFKALLTVGVFHHPDV